jgi:asparagine synthase (glutamine-hydrolysing)
MSAQAGIWDFEGHADDRVTLERISSLLTEYGPDGEQIHIDEPVVMLYRPFHTTAESRRDKQPYRLNNHVVITWDGRLDNRAELAELLDVTPIDSTSDVTLFGAAFERWDTDCFQRIIGDWAVCIWDSAKKELILSRDYIGAKQLFYYIRQKDVMWCSHLAPLVLLSDQLKVCDQYIAGYLAFQPEANLTPYDQIRSVPPAAFVAISDSRTVVKKYWEHKPGRLIRYKTTEEYQEHYRHLFRQSVRRRLRSDSPVLATLSGGYDSTSIVCMADDILAKEGAESPRVDTFSYYDSTDQNDDDLTYFTKVEHHRGRQGFHLNLASSGDSLSFDYSNFSAVPGFGHRTELKAGLIELLRANEYRVVLSGNGGDEMNGQALDPRVQLADILVRCQLHKFVPQLQEWSAHLRRPYFQLFGDTLLELLPLSIRAQLRARGAPEPWVNQEFARRHHFSKRQMEDLVGFWFWRPASRDWAQTILTLSRRMSSCLPSQYEQRSPYLDQDFVEFVTAIPLEQLVQPGGRRLLMRRALEELLPAETLTRRTKSSGTRFYCVTLQKHWDELQQILDSPLVSQLGYVRADFFKTALFMMKNGNIPAHPVRLLKALALELWLRAAVGRGFFAIQGADSAEKLLHRQADAA